MCIHSRMEVYKTTSMYSYYFENKIYVHTFFEKGVYVYTFLGKNYTNVIVTCRNQIISNKNPRIIESAHCQCLHPIRMEQPVGATTHARRIARTKSHDDGGQQMPIGVASRGRKLWWLVVSRWSAIWNLWWKKSMLKNPNGIWIHQMRGLENKKMRHPFEEA